MKKKVIALILSLILIISACPLTAFAETTVSGTYYQITWTLEGGVLTISGTGAIDGFGSYAPWYSYRSKIESVVIESGITSIDDLAFFRCTSLKSVTIPDSIELIGYLTFAECTALESITVDTTNQHYSSDSYGVLFNKDKTKLIMYPCGNSRTFYKIPNTVTSIDSQAFADCRFLESVTIGNDVKSIGDSAFSNCASLKSVTIPDSVTSIGTYAFWACSSLESATIGNGVTSIGNSAFSNCASLKSITIPDSVTSIGDHAFYVCDSLESVTIGNGVTSIGSRAFWLQNSSLTDVYYSGSEEEWNKISISYDNYALFNATIHFNSSGNGSSSGSTSTTTTTTTTTTTKPTATTAKPTTTTTTTKSSATTPCKRHKYTSASGDICTVCGYVFQPQLVEYNKTMKAAKNGTPIRTNYYASNGNAVKYLSKGEIVQVTHYFYNSLGNKWYKTSDGYYIYSENLTEASIAAPTANSNAGTGSAYRYDRVATFKSSDGKNTYSQIAIGSGRITIPGAPEARQGYTFLGWSTSPNSTTADSRYTPGKIVMLPKNVTLYAVWEKEPYYTLTFDSNADGQKVKVTSYSAEVMISAKKTKRPTYTIPENATAARSGYAFLGWSTDPNAKEAQYKPGDSITIGNNTTLYAVWYDLSSVEGVGQNTETCTSAATAVILARKLIVDGKFNEKFTYEDVRKSCNSYFGYDTFGIPAPMTNGTTTYKLKGEELDEQRGDEDKMVSAIVELLDKHPEGIVFYFNYNGTSGIHAIVISRYEINEDGSYQFYAYDSWSSSKLGEYKLEEIAGWGTYSNKNTSFTYKNFFLMAQVTGYCSGSCVWYVDYEMKK